MADHGLQCAQNAVAPGGACCREKVRDSFAPRNATNVDEGVAALSVLRARLVVLSEPADDIETHFDSMQRQANHAAGSKAPLDDGTPEALTKALREARGFWNERDRNAPSVSFR